MSQFTHHALFSVKALAVAVALTSVAHAQQGQPGQTARGLEERAPYRREPAVGSRFSDCTRH